MRTVRDIKDLKDKKVLLRVDFNVPVENEKIQEDYKIKAHKETIDFLVRNGAKILLLSHHSDNFFSFNNYIDQIEKILGQKLVFLKSPNSTTMSDHSSAVFLLENIRLFPGEEKNDEKLARSLSSGFNYYVNDAFSVCHRDHASISAITRLLPSYAGFLLEKEIFELSSVLNKPVQGKTLIIGGGKVGTKVHLVKNFTSKADNILIGGAVANNFFKAKGFEIGKSIFDENYVDELIPLLNNPMLIIPKDIIISPDRIGKVDVSSSPTGNIDPNHYILDIGPETAKVFSDLIKNSKMIIWNGPMGQFENKPFEKGTKEIVKAMSETKAYTIIGGGDTISVFNKFGNLNNVDFVSTGGGAMLEFLSGNKLPGLEALGYYK